MGFFSKFLRKEETNYRDNYYDGDEEIIEKARHMGPKEICNEEVQLVLKRHFKELCPAQSIDPVELFQPDYEIVRFAHISFPDGKQPDTDGFIAVHILPGPPPEN